MLYTLLKFLGWGVLLACIGVCIGWALRSLKGRGELARAATPNVDPDELERLRGRLADLEPVVAERDRLRIQLADVRHADSPGIVGGDIPDAPSPRPDGGAAHAQEPDGAYARESDDVPDPGDEHGITVPEQDAIAPGQDAPVSEQGEAGQERYATVTPMIAPVGDAAGHGDAMDDEEPPVLDLVAAAQVIGKKVAIDDLTVVEGIGPKISELCSGIGITTWRQLADTDVADLQSMLDAAGSRYAVHKPGTWSRQAALLAAGRWLEFTTVTDDPDGGS